MFTTQPEIPWPARCDLFGVQVSVTNYAEAEELIIRGALNRRSMVVTHLPVHGVVHGATHREYRERVNSFEIVAPDGQPVRWALNWFGRAGLSDRVYGPELMMRVCGRAAEVGVSVYLYGSSPEVVQRLRENLRARWPGLKIAGWESPPFRALNNQEKREVAERINNSGAGLVFVGLGLPKQDLFAYEMRGQIRAVQMCVGAAFDFHAGTKPMAPAWMQRSGLEWLFRLVQEPGRLWRRYLLTNTVFLFLVLRRLVVGPSGPFVPVADAGLGKTAAEAAPTRSRTSW
ncbi:MAG TPA: WecB/TagA/CpsF family glycosyltransferase [Tepidisphaeraceae bacterium]|nr:WecB/TagA/CpsF family glycosyltransferase [Tepidisphaeraceae bacterium]